MYLAKHIGRNHVEGDPGVLESEHSPASAADQQALLKQA
jgi:hypothetical protein